MILGRARADLQLDFGGKPGGIGDNHGALVSAIASKSKYGHDGLDLYIPAGVWTVRGNSDVTGFSVRSGLRIRGAGIGKTVLQADYGTTFDRFLHGSNIIDFELCDLTLDMSLQTGGFGRGVEFNGASNVALRRVGIRHTVADSGGYAALFTTSPASNVWITGCLLEDIADAAIRFAAGSTIDGVFIQGNRISCDAADYLEVVSPISEPDETGNYVTENGVSRWTSGGGAGAGEGPYTTPTLGPKWRDVPNWERVQYYKHSNAVFIQGACEVVPGEVVEPGETIFTLGAGYQPARTTSRRVAGGIPVQISSVGSSPAGAVTYQGEMPFASWLDWDMTFRLGGA